MMRNTSYTKNGISITQVMQNSLGHQKGMRTILIERGEWKDGMLKICHDCEVKRFDYARIEYYKDIYNPNDRRFSNYCCAWRCLSLQPDFLSQKELLTEVVESYGCEILFYPKYHCELNYIEMVWAYLKAKLRRECQNDFQNMLKRIPQILLNEIDITFFKRVERHCLRFMSGYRIGLEGPELDYAMKKYSSHRRLHLSQLGDIRKEFEQIKQ